MTTSPPYKTYKVLVLDVRPFGNMEAKLNKTLTYYVGNGWEVLSLTPTEFAPDRSLLEVCVVLQKDKS